MGWLDILPRLEFPFNFRTMRFPIPFAPAILKRTIEGDTFQILSLSAGWKQYYRGQMVWLLQCWGDRPELKMIWQDMLREDCQFSKFFSLPPVIFS